MGRNTTMSWRAGMLEVFVALLLAAFVACTFIIAIAPGAQAHAAQTLTTGTSQLSAQASYSSYALLASDGFVYPANSSGAKISETWAGNNDPGETINPRVTKLFIAADVEELHDNFYYKYEEYGEVKEKTNHWTFSLHYGDYMAKIQQIEFLLKNGKSSVARIEDGALDYLKLLNQVINFDKTQIAEVPYGLFRGCESLVSITLPNTVTSIADCAFEGCIKLNVLNMGNSLLSIGEEAFAGCTELGLNNRAVIFPRSFMRLGYRAFYGCTNLHTVIFLNTNNTVVLEGSGVFDDTNLKKVYVNNRQMKNYSTDTGTKNWGDYADKIHGFLEVKKPADVTYTGQAFTPKPTVTWCGEPLGSANYTVSYSNNTNAGTAKVTVRGKGAYALKHLAYTGTFNDKLSEYNATATATFKIKPAKLTAAKLAFTKATYAGKALKPAVSGVRAGKLPVGKAGYSASYKNNTNVGTATVTVSGKGNYTGSLKKTFKINPYGLSKAAVSGVSDKTYTGKALTQASLKVRANGATLKAGKDYELSYSDNTNAGVAKVVIAGEGNFTGKVTKTFTIKPASVAKAKLVLSKTEFGYNGRKQVPAVKTVGGKKLKAGRDFTAKYSNANSKNIGTYTVKVVGKGNYKGTSAIAKYRIVKVDNPMKVTFQPASLGNKSSFSIKKALKVTGAQGKVTFHKVSGTSKIRIAKNGKVTVSKSLAAGKYPLTVAVKAAGNANYKVKTVKVSFYFQRTYHY